MADSNGLGQILWDRVEAAQGYAFISDVVTSVSDDDAMRTAENSLLYTQRTAVILRRFIKQFSEPAPKKDGETILKKLEE